MHTHTDTETRTQKFYKTWDWRDRHGLDAALPPTHGEGLSPMGLAPYGSVQAMREASPLFCALSGQVHLSWALSPHGDPGPGAQPRGQHPGLGLPESSRGVSHLLWP